MTAQEKIAEIIFSGNNNINWDTAYYKADQILALEGGNSGIGWRIAVVEKDAELPTKPKGWGQESMDFHAGYYRSEQNISEEGWVREVENG